MTSGEFLKQLRNKQKLSLRALSFLSGVSHTQISDLEKNINFGTLEKLEKILSCLKATPKEIERYYYLRDCEKTPKNIMNKLKETKNENETLRAENIKLKHQISISNNSNIGTISVGNVNISSNSTGEVLDLQGLSLEQVKEVKKYIEFLKIQNEITKNGHNK